MRIWPEVWQALFVWWCLVLPQECLKERRRRTTRIEVTSVLLDLALDRLHLLAPIIETELVEARSSLALALRLRDASACMLINA